MAKSSKKEAGDCPYADNFWTEPPALVQWAFGLLVMTPLIWTLTIPGLILSIPLFMRMIPWNYVMTRPHRFVFACLLLSMKVLREWVVTRAYGRIFIGRSVGTDTHPRPWQLPYSLRVRYRFLLLFQRYFGMTRLRWFEHALQNEALEYCKKNPPKPEHVVRKIPEIDPTTITPEEFYEKYVKNPHPVILKGMNKNSEAVKKWSVDYFMKYKDDIAPVQEHGESPDVERLCFGDYLQWVKRNENTTLEEREESKYLANFANLFNWHPELVKELDVEKMSKWLGPTGNRLLGCHMFIGLKDTATPFHSANTMNWFCMVRGRKKWTFVHPENDLMIYPLYSHDVFYTGSMLEYPEPPSEVMEMDFPLWKYCPRYEAIVEDGDVMLNPSWYWHRIQNIDKITIGCATRWRITPPMDINLLDDTFLTFCARFWANAMIYLSKKEGEEPLLTDETTLTLDQRLSRFLLGKQLADQKRPSIQQGIYKNHPFALLKVPKHARTM
eukprot:Rmarinus@m.19545